MTESGDPAVTESGDEVVEEKRPGRDRAAALSVLLLALGAICLWAASRMTWVSVTSSDGLGADRRDDLLGSTWAAALTPLALVLLAAIAASFAVRGWAARAVAVIVALVAVAAAVPSVQLLTGGATDSRAAALAELPARAEVTMAQAAILPAVVTLVGALCALAAAANSMRKPAARKVLSSKYDGPAVRRDEVARRARSVPGGEGTKDEGEDLTERMLWDALDAGEDPTDESGTRRSTDENGPLR